MSQKSQVQIHRQYYNQSHDENLIVKKKANMKQSYVCTKDLIDHIRSKPKTSLERKSIVPHSQTQIQRQSGNPNGCEIQLALCHIHR